jgi:serine/threonine protein kinase
VGFEEHSLVFEVLVLAPYDDLREVPLTLVQSEIFESERNHRKVVRSIYRCPVTFGLWYAGSTVHPDLPANPWKWDSTPRQIHLESVYPAYNPKTMTLAETSGPVYHKKIDLLRYASQRWGDMETKDITAREIRRCEFLRQNPHPNICHYHGFTLDDAGLRVSALVFDGYDGSLHDIVRDGASFDAAKCVRHLKRAIEHLHSLGLVHCDIKPDNIFVRNSPEHYILGDFDSTHYDDTFFGVKTGTLGWVPDELKTMCIALREIDWYSYDMVYAWLVQKGFGHPDLEREYPATSWILENEKIIFGADRKWSDKHNKKNLKTHREKLTEEKEMNLEAQRKKLAEMRDKRVAVPILKPEVIKEIQAQRKKLAEEKQRQVAVSVPKTEGKLALAPELKVTKENVGEQKLVEMKDKRITVPMLRTEGIWALALKPEVTKKENVDVWCTLYETASNIPEVWYTPRERDCIVQ